jgi:hypothetical protein
MSTAAHDGHRPDERYAAAFPLRRLAPHTEGRHDGVQLGPKAATVVSAGTDGDQDQSIVTPRSLAEMSILTARCPGASTAHRPR